MGLESHYARVPCWSICFRPRRFPPGAESNVRSVPTATRCRRPKACRKFPPGNRIMTLPIAVARITEQTSENSFHRNEFAETLSGLPCRRYSVSHKSVQRRGILQACLLVFKVSYLGATALQFSGRVLRKGLNQSISRRSYFVAWRATAGGPWPWLCKRPKCTRNPPRRKQTSRYAMANFALDLAEWSYFWLGVERAALAKGTFDRQANVCRVHGARRRSASLRDRDGAWRRRPGAGLDVHARRPSGLGRLFRSRKAIAFMSSIARVMGDLRFIPISTGPFRRARQPTKG